MSLRFASTASQRAVRGSVVPAAPAAKFCCPARRQARRAPACATRSPTRDVSAAAAPPADTVADFDTSNGKLISSTEVASFIQRDDIMDQMLRWALIEAAEGGFRNFGLPMTVDPFYLGGVLWGFKIGVYKDGSKLTDLSINFDNLNTQKHEWVGRGDDGFPIFEGRASEVLGKNIEIWKLDSTPVSEELRGAIRAFCNGFAQAMNRYYAFGSVFVDDAT